MNKSIKELSRELNLSPEKYEAACRRAMREDAQKCLANKRKMEKENLNEHE